MLDTYLKNRGSTKTIIHSNNLNKVNEINWDADYDGNVANISLDLQNNGSHKHYDINLDNNDLANILNIPSVNIPIHRRLKSDFQKKLLNPRMYQIDFESPSSLIEPHKFMQSHQANPNPIYLKNETFEPDRNSVNTYSSLPLVQDLLESAKQPTHISSPLSNEEFIIPLTINKGLLKTPRKRNKTHKTHRVYKKIKTNSRRSSRRSSKKSSRRYTL